MTVDPSAAAASKPGKAARFLGVLCLDTAFPRLPGDGGNPASYPMPVRLRTVAGCEVTRIVRAEGPDPALIRTLCAAARDLVAEGAVGLVTTCGFLIHAQRALAAAVPVPVMASALMLGPAMRAARGGRPVGVLTADAAMLGVSALHAAGLDPADTPVEGLQDVPAFRDLILVDKALQDRPIDRDAIETAVVARGRLLVARRPDLGAIVLECANLPPYAEALRHATGRPVVGIGDAAALIWSTTIVTDAEAARPR